MKLETAQKAKKKIEELESAKKQLDLFYNTEEFCNIQIKGEDGAEREYHLFIGHKSNKNEVVQIRKTIGDVLIERVERISKEIQNM